MRIDDLAGLLSRVSLRALRADYKAACAARAGRITHPRDVMLVVITETARHCGHADILREQVGGRTGR